MKEIIRKWYVKLKFPTRFDEEFEKLLCESELNPSVTVESIANNTENCQYNLLHSLYLLENLQKLYEERGIPEEILLDTAFDIVRWTEIWSEINGKMGLDLMGWISGHLTAKLFKIGRLQYEFGIIKKDYLEYGITAGERCISVHIPADGPLTPQKCEDSFKRAEEFFAKYFHEYEFRFFTCNSWLLDDTVEKYSGEDSNIAKFRRRYTVIDRTPSFSLLKYIFRWDARRENIDSFTDKEGFQKKIKSAVLNGEQFYDSLGFITKGNC